MIDGLTKHRQDPLWDRLGRRLAARGVTANQVTWAGTVGVFACAAAYPLHGSALGLAIGLGLCELTDNLDGAVARVTGTATRYGAWLDALTDRYKEAATLAAVAWVHDAWLLVFFAVTGGMLTSYTKARAAMEARLPNTGWPDLMERLERVLVLLVALVAQAAWPDLGGGWAPVHVGLIVLAVGTHLSALQRSARAARWLAEEDAR